MSSLKSRPQSTLAVENGIPEIWDGAVFPMNASTDPQKLEIEVRRLFACLSIEVLDDSIKEIVEDFQNLLSSGQSLGGFTTKLDDGNSKPVCVVFVNDLPHFGKALAGDDAMSLVQVQTVISHAIANVWLQAGENAIWLANYEWEREDAFLNIVGNLENAVTNADRLVDPTGKERVGERRSLTVVAQEDDFGLVCQSLGVSAQVH